MLELIEQSAAGVPLCVHGWGQGTTSHVVYLAAFLVGMGEDSYFSISGSSKDVVAAGGDGSQWAEHSFPRFPEFDRPLGRPQGPATSPEWGVFLRRFEHVDVFLDLSNRTGAGVPSWNATLAWKKFPS